MTFQKVFLIFLLTRLTSAALFCSSNGTTFCMVKDQSISVGEDFVVAREDPFTAIVLSGTQFTHLPTTIFKNYPNITFFSAGSNKLKVLNIKIFANAGNLKKLYLQKGELSRIPDSVFKSCISLEELQLSEQRISVVAPNAFRGLVRLRKLMLSK